MRRSVVLLLGACMIRLLVQAQYHQGTSISGSFSQFVDVPVSHFTGTAQLGISFGTVEEGPLRVSLGLSYHSTGLKVGELASDVGAGWMLTGGGVIYRQIKHLLDEDDRGIRKGYYNYGGTLSGYSSNHTAIENDELDGEADLFSFYMPGYRGKFYFSGGDGTNPSEVVVVPEQNLKVEVTNIDCPGTGLCYIEGFKITAPDGTRYYFGKYTSTAGFAVERTINKELVLGHPLRDYASAWYLAKIETYDGKHDIEYVYRTSNYEYETLAPSQLKIIYNSSGAGTTTETPIHASSVQTLSGTQIRYQRMDVYSKVLDSIKTRSTTVDFDHVDRTDVSTFDTGGKWAISGLRFNEGTSHCVRYAFTQTYFTDGSGLSNPFRKRLKLDQVQKKACTGTDSEPPWIMTYIDQTSVAHRLSKAMDHWGYQNGKTNNNSSTTLIPVANFVTTDNLNNFNYGSANRDIDTTYARKGLLQKVEYPWGGYTEMFYEGNRALDENAQGAQINITMLATGHAPGTPYCNITQYESQSVMTLTQEKIDNGYFLIGISNHIGGCGGPHTIVEFDVIQNGSVKIHRDINGITPGEILPVALQGNGLTTSSQITFRLRVNNEGEGYAHVYYYPNSVADAYVGGMRIQKLLTHDGFSSSRDIIRNFKYRKSFTDNKSSGDYIGKPKYAHQLYYTGSPPIYTVMAEPFSLAPLTSFEGYHVGYTRVEEAHNGNGTIVHTFRTEDFGQSADYPSYGLPPRVLAGTVDSMKYLNAGNQVLAFESSEEKTDNYLPSSSINIRLTQISGISTVHTHNIYSNYTRKPMRPETTVNYLDGVATEKEYFYSSTAYQLEPNEITYTNSDGKEVKTKIKYTGNYEQGLSLLGSFRNVYHILNVPYQVEQIIDGNTVDGRRTEWSYFNSSGLPVSTSSGNIPYPYYQQRFERTWNASGSLLAGAWRTLNTFEKYNVTFGFVERSKADSWSQRYFNYDALGNMIRDSFLNYVSEWEFYAGSRLLKSTTSIDGQKESYTYDVLLRPGTITDECSGTVVTRTYGFQDATNSNYSWVKTHTNYVAVTGSAVDIIEDFTYLDGLGRPVQMVGKGQSQTSSRDIIHALEYDNQGRAFKVFRPYHSTLTTGKYVSIPGTYDHTLNQYEASPLNRTWKTTPPGWYATEHLYGTNGVGEVSGYSPGTLTKQTLIDGNGHHSISFTDRKGRQIAREQTNGAGTKNTTRYEYDDKDRSVKVIPPGASGSSTNLIYTWLYDARDNAIRMKVPGKAEIEHRYNNRNLPAYTQDGYLGGQSKWYAYQYDSYGRETRSGFFTGTPAANLSFSQASISEDLTENIYGAAGTFKVDKLITSRSKILGTSSWLENTRDYNACGQMTGVSGNSIVNIGNTSAESHTLTYDWMDNLLKDTYEHVGPAGTKTLVEEYTWDQVGRPDVYYHKIGSAAKVQITNLDFNHKEELTKKVYGPFGSLSMDYSYLSSGLFSKVNTGGSGALFYEELKYDVSTPFSGIPVQMNGNIAVAISQVKGHDRHAFGYQYDYLDRMIAAKYLRLSGSTGGVIGTNDYNVDVTYDARGNIGSLVRKGLYRDGNAFQQETIDNLVYTYPLNSNVLTSVADNAPAVAKDFGFKAGSGNYTYDSNGNTTYDPGRGVTYTYNHLDLPTLADWGDGRTIEWTYDARGNLLQKLVRRGSTVLENRRYVGQIEYGGNQIEMIYHNAGRLYNKNYDPVRLDLDGIITGTETAYGTEIQATALIQTSSNIQFIADDYIELNGHFTVDAGSEFQAIIGSGPTGEDWRYDYAITDHLGNTRIIFSDLNNNGSISDDEIIAEYQYYPFGLRMDGDWAENTSLNNEKYQYNGIEYLQDHGLNINFARYRMLDAGLGRWLGVDPKAEATMRLSPYNSMGNNPISNVDPNGDFFFVAALGPILSGIVSGAIVGAAINGTASAISGGNFLNGTWKGAITGAVGGGLGAIGGGTFAANLALGTAEGAITGGIGSTLNGGNFWDGAKFGAFSGALLTTVSSENFGNLLKGEGFRNNSNVFSNLVDRGIGEQGILDYFGFDATFDSQMAADAKFWFNNQGAHGISIGPTSFESFGLLKGNYLKEAYHLRKYLKHGVGGLSAGELGDWWPEERLGAIFNYKNQGLYPGSTSNYLDIIGSTESMMSLFDYSHRSFTQRWWHFVYKIPRRY
jgi:RHS repeat-associated protein